MGFSLWGKLGLDVTPFQQGLAKAKASVTPAAAKMGEQIRGKMLEAFGAAGAIALVKKSVENAMRIVQGSTKAGVDTSTFQAMDAVAKRAGLSIEDLTEVIKNGGPAADDLKSAIESAKQEMEDTGQLIEGTTVKRIAELGDKMEQLFGKIAPGLAWMVDWLGKIYDIAGRGVGAAVSGAQILWGKLTGDQSMVQAGKENAYGYFNDKTTSDQSKVQAAAEIAAEAVRKSKDKKPERSEKPPKLDASSLVQSGGLLSSNRGTAVNPAMDQLVNNTREIAQMMRRLE